MSELARFFPMLDRADLEAASARFSSLEIGRGVAIIEEGENDAALLFVVEGRVAIRTDEWEIATVGAGGIVGEIGMFGGALRTATVTAIQPCLLLMLDRNDYLPLVEKGSPVAWEVERRTLRQLVERLREVDARIAEIGEGTEDQPPEGIETDGEPLLRHLDVVAALQRAVFFADAALGVLDDIGSRMSARRFAKGDVLCEQGTHGDDLYLLAEGTVAVTVRSEGGKRETVATLDPGDILGVASVFHDRPRMASCVAAEDVVALRMDRAACLRFVDANNRAGSVFRTGMIRAIGDQTAYANAQFAMLSLARKKRTAERLARLGIEAHGRHVRGQR